MTGQTIFLTVGALFVILKEYAYLNTEYVVIFAFILFMIGATLAGANLIKESLDGMAEEVLRNFNQLLEIQEQGLKQNKILLEYVLFSGFVLDYTFSQTMLALDNLCDALEIQFPRELANKILTLILSLNSNSTDFYLNQYIRSLRRSLLLKLRKKGGY